LEWRPFDLHLLLSSVHEACGCGRQREGAGGVTGWGEALISPGDCIGASAAFGLRWLFVGGKEII